MPTYVFLAVLAAALCHAIWNALLKSEGKPWDNATALSYACALLACIILAFLPAPDAASWPYILASGSTQFFYMTLVAKVYKKGDYAVGYPLMRGLSPPFTALFAFVFLNEAMQLMELFGLLAISCGVLLMGIGAIKNLVSFKKQAFLAVFCGLMISGYALVDGTGVRLSGSPVAYTLWVFMLQGIGVFIYRGVRKQGVTVPLKNWKPWVAAALSCAAYAVALWAMTKAPIAIVAALRESSILFSALVGFIILREKPNLYRILGVIFIAAGMALFRLSL